MADEMADEIAGWLASTSLDGIDGLRDALLAKCDDLSDLQEMEEADVADAISNLGLKSMKVKKIQRAFAVLRDGATPPSPGPVADAPAPAATGGQRVYSKFQSGFFGTFATVKQFQDGLLGPGLLSHGGQGGTRHP